MELKQFYMIDHPDDILDLNEINFHRGPLPIIWCNNSLYTLVPRAFVENYLGFIAICETAGTKFKPSPLVHWDDCYDVNPTIGTLLS